MGLFNAISNVIEDQKKRLTNVVDTFKAIGTNISQGKLTTGIPVAAKYENTLVGKVATNISKPAAIVGIPLVAASVAAPAALLPVAKAAAAKPLQAGAALLVGTTIVKSEKATKAVIDAPSKLNVFTSDVAKAIDTPTTENISNIYKNNPLIAGAATVALVAPIAATTATVLNTAAVRANTAQTRLEEQTKEVSEIATIPTVASPLIAETKAEVLNVPEVKTTAAVAKKKTTKKKTTKKKKKAPAAPKKKKKATKKKVKKAPIKKKKPAKKAKKKVTSKAKKKKKSKR